ncbi:MAG: NUDIX hydrolase [Bacteroidetes bacterium]|nr:NUDIX hydrolase [Bacteroidota bacterium]
MKNELLTLAKRVQAIAESGLHFTESDWDTDRYNDLEKIAIEMLSIITSTPIETVKVHTTERNGYKTPKVDVRSVIINDNNEILLVKERADGRWSMPGGWCDIGYTPVEVAEKEAMEEAGIQTKANRLLAIMDKNLHNYPDDLYYIYKIFIECRTEDYSISTGMETLDVGFFKQDELPELSTPRNTVGQINTMFDFHHGRIHWPIID